VWLCLLQQQQVSNSVESCAEEEDEDDDGKDEDVDVEEIVGKDEGTDEEDDDGKDEDVEGIVGRDKLPKSMSSSSKSETNKFFGDAGKDKDATESMILCNLWS
jgi:hypothetical protein